jgi:exportin-2 (importin alpha re-exporter)
LTYVVCETSSEFIPFAFQILAQLLELHSPDALPPAYENLLGPLLHSSLWESRGNVPALVRLWKALLVRGGPIIAARGHVQALLGIFQKLITLKSTDVSGLELIGLIYESIPK